MMGMSITEKATSLDMDANIPNDKFNLPEGTEIIETGGAMPGMPEGF